MRIFFCLCLFLSLWQHSSSQTNFESKHFTIEPLSEGVYAVIAKSSGYAISNSGIIDLGGKTIVFDAFMCPEAAEDLKTAAEKITGNKVTYLINSHYHDDHTSGNQIFKNATIISTAQTAELMKKLLPEETKEFAQSAKANLDELEKVKEDRLTNYEKEELLKWKSYYQAMLSASTSLQITLPTRTFEKKIILRGKKRKAELLCFGSGHTPSDLFLYLPKVKIAFLGDLLFINHQPWLADGDTDDWKQYLNKIGNMEIGKIVPGHGPVGTKADFEPFKNYIDTVMSTVRYYLNAGQSPINDPSLTIPKPYNNWFLSKFYVPNVIIAYNKRKAQISK